MNRQERRQAEREAAKRARNPTPPAAITRGTVNEITALLKAGDFQGAERVARALVAADRQDIAALILLSESLRMQERFDEAVATARMATLRDRNLAAAQISLGKALRLQDRVYESLACFERALALAPDAADAHHSLGLALLDVGELDIAVEHLRRANSISPKSNVFANSLGVVLTRLGLFQESLDVLERVHIADPTNPHVQFNRAFAFLGLGRLREGWEAYEYGFASNTRQPKRTFDVPRWDGRPLRPDQRVLVWREQGIGDEIRLASCYPDMIALGAPVIIEAEPRLAELFRRSFPAATVRVPTNGPSGASTQPAPDYDLHIPSASLPAILRQDVTAFPAHRRYLEPNTARREQLRQRVTEAGPEPKVGICWRSMKLDVKRLVGYTTLDEWEPVLRTPGVVFVNLQYGERRHLESELQASEERTGVPIIRWDDIDYTDDMNTVAALIDELDLVVSVTTAVSALAGALGKPVFQIGLANDPMQFGLPDRYPWFPSLRPFNRELTDGWEPVMSRVAAAVSTFAAEGVSARPGP